MLIDKWKQETRYETELYKKGEALSSARGMERIASQHQNHLWMVKLPKGKWELKKKRVIMLKLKKTAHNQHKMYNCFGSIKK